jgi:hypothetical protein
MPLLLEPYPVPDIYADGIDHIENLGNCFRMVFFTNARGSDERLVVAKIVRPITSLLTSTEIQKLIDKEPVLGMVPGLRCVTHNGH